VPTVSIDAIAVPPHAFVRGGTADQRGPDQHSPFASFLSAQPDNPPPAATQEVATQEKAPASSPVAQADSPSRQPTNAPSSAQNGQSAGIAEPSSNKAKGITNAAPVATDRPTVAKAKIAPKAVGPDSAGLILPATASPTSPSQAPAAPPAQISTAAAAAADVTKAAVAAATPSVTGGSDTDIKEDTDTKEEAANGDPAAANDSAAQLATAPASTTQNSQPGANADLPANSQTVATVTPAPTLNAEPNANGPGNDELAVIADAPARIDRPSPSVPPPRPAPPLPIASDAAETPITADPSRKTASPNDGGDSQHKTIAIPPNETAAPPAATARLAHPPFTLPAPGTEQAPTTTNVSINGPTAPRSAGIEPDDRPRNVVQLPDSLAVQTQTAAVASTAVITNSTAASPPNQPAVAPVPVAEVAVSIAMQAQSGKSRFEIRLDPPELGRIDVQLNVDSRGNVSSRLVVERPDTLNLLVRDAPQLQRTLQDAGLNIAGGMQFSLADQGFANRSSFAQQNEPTKPRTIRNMSGDTVPVAALQGYAARSSRHGGLDITV